MFCIHCGAKLNDDAKFCSACGKPVAGPAEGLRTVSAEEPRKAVEPVREKTVKETALEEKKLFGKLPLKMLLGILGGVVVVVLAIVLISNAVEEKKRTTILGVIPDPETFFGVSGDHDRYDSWYEHNIKFKKEDVTKEMAEAYVELLCSDEYPFILNETIDFNGGMVRYVFVYNGSQELYDAESRQIMVEYNPSYEWATIEVEILNSGNFELVPVEEYGTEDAGQSVPEPESEQAGQNDSVAENTPTTETAKPTQSEQPTQSAKPAEPEVVAGEISVNNAIKVPDNAVPELDAWSDGAAASDRMITKSDAKVKYDVSHEVVEEYIQMLQSNGFTLVDQYYFSYRDTFWAWAFTCDAVPDAATIEMQYEDTPCHVCVWTADADEEYWVDISSSLQFCDTGLRRGGTTVNETISGPSAGAGLLRLSDGSYQTTDGRLTAAAGTAMVIRDGKTYTCDARWEVEEEDERLWVEDYYRNEGFLFEVPKSSLMEGDVLQMGDLMRERYYVTEKAKFASYNWHTPLFVIAYDDIWKGPELHGTDFEAVTVRIMYYQPGGEAVYYVYAKMHDAEPSEVEALVVVDMSVGSGGSFDNASRLKVGDTVTLNYTGEVFGASYNLYEWEVTDGVGNVSIDDSGDSCQVKAMSKGVATVIVTYKYGVTEPDVLTGNPTHASKSKTQSYNFIIE